jgi:hypothetical protein
MRDEADQREEVVPDPPALPDPPEPRVGADPLTIALVVFFVGVIVIVAALLLLPMLGRS